MTTVPKIACCLNEAVGKATGGDGCQDPDCQFAHSVEEAKKNFFAIADGKRVFFQRVLATRHPLAAKYGGRLTKNGVFYTMKITDYLKYFEKVLVPMEIAERDNFLSEMHDEIRIDNERIDAYFKETEPYDEYEEFAEEILADEKRVLDAYYQAELECI
jgi:hypothetical protein